MNPGRFWFSVPSPYTTHDPMLGFVIRSDPVFMNTVATSWAGMSVYIERTTAMSSTCWPIPGKSSLTSVPDRPMGVNLNGEPMATPLSPIVLPSIFTSSGFGSQVSMCEGAPWAKMWMTDFAVAWRGGGRGARGLAAAEAPLAASGPQRRSAGSSIVASPRAPRPIPTRFRNLLRVRK